MMGDPCISQHSGHTYPCTNGEGLFITDADKRLSTSLPFPFSHLFQILSDPSPPKHTHTHTIMYVTGSSKMDQISPFLKIDIFNTFWKKNKFLTKILCFTDLTRSLVETLVFKARLPVVGIIFVFLHNSIT